jgi:hypothetical protein
MKEDGPKSNWANYKSIRHLSPGKIVVAPNDSEYLYCAVGSPAGYAQLQLLPGKSEQWPKNQPYSEINGWKIHISVHPDDIALAWDNIVSYLQEEKILAKVAMPKSIKKLKLEIDPNTKKLNPQAGKMIVLYPCDAIGNKPAHTIEDWQRIINGIEQRLANAGVRKGKPVITDRPINRSLYCYYRNESITSIIEDFLNEIIKETLKAVEAKVRKEKPIIGKDKIAKYIEEMIKKDLVPIDSQVVDAAAQHYLIHFFSQEDIMAMVPTTFAELSQPREALLKLPLHKRYKLNEDVDLYEGLHIESPHTLLATQQMKLKERGYKSL